VRIREEAARGGLKYLEHIEVKQPSTYINLSIVYGINEGVTLAKRASSLIPASSIASAIGG